MNRKGNAGRSKLSGIVFVVIVGYVAFRFFLSESPTLPGSQPATTAGDGAPASQPTYASRATDNGWPEINKEQSSQGMDSNLLTENYYIVLDGSGSMQDDKCSGGTSKISAAARALSGFVENVPSDANVGLAVFSNRDMRELAPLQPSHQIDVVRLTSGIVPGGATPLRSAIRFAYDRLNAQGRKQLGYGRYHLIVITDGMASKGEDPSDIVSQMLNESPINLHTIGFCIGKNHVLNQPGRSVYHAADNPDELEKGLGSVLAEAPQFDLSEFKQ